MFFEQRGIHLFTLLGVSVSVSMWYVLLMGFVILLWPAMGAMTVAEGVIWALAITTSFLVHDYGHALMAKRYKLGPSIFLSAFGGVYRTEREAASDGQDAKVLLAGPIAGLVLAGLMALLLAFAPGAVAASPVTQLLCFALLWVSLVWSVVNLILPIWPLDSGRLLHLFLRRVRCEETARRWTLHASIFTLVPVGVIGLVHFQSLLVLFFVGYALMHNFQALKYDAPLLQRRGGRSKQKASSFHEDLLEEAEQAMKEEDWREAARLAHHMRSVGAMPSAMLERVWVILGIATMKMGDYEEALNYLQRAPKKSRVRKAIRFCEEEVNQKRGAAG